MKDGSNTEELVKNQLQSREEEAKLWEMYHRSPFSGWYVVALTEQETRVEGMSTGKTFTEKWEACFKTPYPT